MPVPKIDPLDVPLRGVEPIAEFLEEDKQVIGRALRRGLIDATKHGRIYVTTARRILASPYVAGRTATAQ